MATKTERMIKAFATTWAGETYRLFPNFTSARHEVDGARVVRRGTKVVGPYGEWAIVSRNGRVTFYDRDEGVLVATEGGWTFTHWSGRNYFCPDKEA